MDAERPLSANERIKAASNFLRGTIAEGLRQIETGALADDDTQLTKFHGFYQQDDRDLRAERGKQRMEKAFSFMVRMRVPAGILTPVQWLKVEKLAVERANHTIRLTTRETVQFHGILKGNLKPLMQGLHDDLLDTIAACGDVNRNVIATTDPWRRALYATVSGLARDIAAHLLPHSRAWHEIWLEDEKVSGGVVEDEPIYGRTYMPRKFKIAVALPPHNDVDVFAHDLGFIAIVERGRIIGYNVVVGGGMGMTHGEPETYPRTGNVIGFCKARDAIDVAAVSLEFLQLVRFGIVSISAAADVEKPVVSSKSNLSLVARPAASANDTVTCDSLFRRRGRREAHVQIAAFGSELAKPADRYDVP